MNRERERILSSKWAELKQDVGENRLSLILAAFLTSILFILIFARQRLYPFGDYTLVYTDGDQYISLYRMVVDALLSGEGPFYTFHAVLGNNLIPTAAYYAMSPFNVLLLLFPQNPVAGIHFTAYCKYVTASVAFCLLLNARREERVAEKAVFSTCYAFIGYMSFFAWNLSWMDGVFILPLVCLGIMRLAEEKKTGLFVFAIAYAVFSNFYIGYMVCIAAVLLYLTWCAFAPEGGKGFLARVKESLSRFLLCLLTGVGLSGIVLVPAIAGLPDYRKLDLSVVVDAMQQNFKPVAFFSMFFTGRIDDWHRNLPIVFFGILPLLLVVLFFFDKNMPRRRKILAVAIVFLFAFSFWNSAVNMIWHGMSLNYAFNYRYSFILSFFLLLLAFDMLECLELANISFVKTGMFLAVFCISVWNDTQDSFFAKDITLDVVLIFAGLVLLRVISGKISTFCKYFRNMGQDKKRVIAIAAILVLMCLNVYRNSIMVMWPDVRTSIPETTFSQELSVTKNAIQTIEDTSFYRMEKDFRLGRSDAPLFYYYGISNYASTENEQLLNALREYGIGHTWVWGFHLESTPLATDALLGMKYILSKSDLSRKALTEHAFTDGIHVYENHSALPLVMFSGVLPAFLPGENAFERMNVIWDAFATDHMGTVFQQVSSIEETEDEWFVRSFTATKEAGKPVYLYLNQPTRGIYVTADGTTRAIPYSEERYVYYIGTFPSGTDVRIYLHVPESLQQQLKEQQAEKSENETIRDTRSLWMDVQEEPVTLDAADKNGKASGATRINMSEVYLYMEDTDTISVIAESVQDKTTSLHVKGRADASALNGAHVCATILADTAGYAVTTIPYDEAWRIDVDGVRVQPVRYIEQFLAVPVEGGEHTVEMYYTPRGFVAGVLLTILSVIVLVLSQVEKHLRGKEKTES